MGCLFSRMARRPHRHAAVRRRRLPAHLLRGRHHRPRDPADRLRAGAQERRHGLRGVLRHRSLIVEDNVCRGVVALDLTTGELQRDPRQGRGLRHRRRGPRLLQEHQLPDQHRRRRGHRLPRRRAAGGHGVHPVPPHHAGRQRRADHRGRARRGRLSAQLRGRPLHVQVRAQQEASWPAATWSRAPSGRRSWRAAASTAACCSTCGTGRGADRGAPAADPRAGDRLRRRRPGRQRRCRSSPAPTTPWAASACDIDGLHSPMQGFFAAGECSAA